jgi:hypothetical protein
MPRCLFAFASFVLTLPFAAAAGLKFEVTYDAKLAKEPASGRLIVAIGKGRLSYSNTTPPGGPLLGKDVANWKAGEAVVLDKACLFFPLESIDMLAAGEYRIEARLFRSQDLTVPNAPGNWVAKAVTAKLDPATGTTVKLTLDEELPDAKPADTKTHKFVHLPSKKLSDFHGRPMVTRFSVTLPTNFESEPDKRYPLIVHIGGFGTRYTSGRMRPDPRFVQILLDGAGPHGDPYQVDSANNGPYGAALVEEVIPYVEKNFRAVPSGTARFTTGGSTGGWVSLALQLFYPDTFNGCWSQCPDGIDFRAFELINIYSDENAYVNKFGFERPSKRTIDGDTIFTVRYESKIERVLGRGDRWELGGLDWCSWNATFGPRGDDGLPKPLWDGKTGAIDKTVQQHWEKYDLRLYTERNWKTLGPKLAGGKVNIWVGDADDYFLNNAVHRYKAMATQLANPPFDGKILIDMRQPHSSGGWTQREMLDDMAARAMK